MQVTFPSDILEAEVAAKGAYNGLLLGLGAVALLVGGVGIANVMVISVLERRSEIGLRRAIGTTRRHVAEQFLAEAVLLSALGGLTGTVLGGSATAIYALTQHWSVQIPALALYGGVGSALAIGAIAPVPGDASRPSFPNRSIAHGMTTPPEHSHGHRAGLRGSQPVRVDQVRAANAPARAYPAQGQCASLS